jgi:hypothetical protein
MCRAAHRVPWSVYPACPWRNRKTTHSRALADGNGATVCRQTRLDRAFSPRVVAMTVAGRRFPLELPGDGVQEVRVLLIAGEVDPLHRSRSAVALGWEGREIRMTALRQPGGEQVQLKIAHVIEHTRLYPSRLVTPSLTPPRAARAAPPPPSSGAPRCPPPSDPTSDASPEHAGSPALGILLANSSLWDRRAAVGANGNRQRARRRPSGAGADACSGAVPNSPAVSLGVIGG